MAAELGTNFSLDAALRNGLIPLIVSANAPGKTLATYITLYLKEEVKEEGLVRDIGAFARFLEAISFSHGSLGAITRTIRWAAIFGGPGVAPRLISYCMVSITSTRWKLRTQSKFTPKA